MTRLLLVSACAGFLLIGCNSSSDSKEEKLPAVDTTTIPATSSTPAPSAVDTGSRAIENGNDVTGSYFALDSLPADFSEIEHLLLATIDEKAKPAPLNGFIRPKARSAKDYTLVDPKIDGKNLTFTTVAVDGVSYSFTGAFEMVGDFAMNPPAAETSVLKGTLTKMKDRAKVAETPVRFGYVLGD